MDDFWDDLLKTSPIKLDIAKVKKIYLSKISIDYEIMELVEKIKNNGYRLAIMANELKEAMDYKIRKFSLDKYFDRIYSSAHQKIPKPELEIYRHIIKDLGVKAEETLFIDNKEKNLIPAQNIGIQTILFKSQKELEEDLKKLGISCN